jgi:hypothetical protein
VEDLNVTGKIGDLWGRKAHRKASIEKCENGFIVEYDAVKVVKVPALSGDMYAKTEEQVRTSRRTRVFILIQDVLEFLNDYFSVEVGQDEDSKQG